MALRESIIYSLNEYRNARIKRREAFGPDLIDTIGDIGKATYNSAKETAQKLISLFRINSKQHYMQQLRRLINFGRIRKQKLNRLASSFRKNSIKPLKVLQN